MRRRALLRTSRGTLIDGGIAASKGSVVVLTLRHRPRLIHHNSAFDGGTFVRDALLCLVARLLRTPLLINIHGSHAELFGPLPRMRRICRHLILRLSTALGVLSSSEVDEFRAAWPWLPDKVLVVKTSVMGGARLES